VHAVRVDGGLMRRALSREALTVLAFSGAQLALGLVGTRLLTQVAEPHALGEYYLYVNLAMWLTLPTAGSYMFVWKNWTIARATGRARSFAGSIARGLAWQAGFCVLGCLVLRATGVVYGSWRLLGILGAAALGLAVNQALDQVQALERRRVLAGVLGLLSAPVRQIALAAAALLLVGATGDSLLAASSLFGLGTATLSAWLFLRTLDSPYMGQRETDPAACVEDLVAMPRFLRFTLPFLLTSLGAQAATSAERWGLALRATPDATALFVQALGLSLAASTAVSLPFTNYFTPIISQAAAATRSNPLLGARRPAFRYIAFSAVSLSLAALALAVLARPLTGIFFGPRYRGIFELLPWAMAGQCLFALGQAISIVPIMAENTSGAAVAYVASRVAYVAVLLLVPCPANCALWFSECFALGNVLYLVLIMLVAARALRVHYGALTLVNPEP
jgi:O-antigen/teichoic acid export membrane protein